MSIELSNPSSQVFRSLLAGSRKSLLTIIAGCSLLFGTVEARAQATSLPKPGQHTQISKSTPPVKDDWQVIVGGGVVVAPKYEGSDEMGAMPAPILSVTWRDRVFADMQRGIGAYAVQTDRFKLGFSVGLAPGRDQDDADALNGLGDIDNAARGHILASYSFGPVRLHADVSQDFGGSDGLQIEPGVTYMHPVSRDIRLSAGVSATWASDDYMESFFGVSSHQSTRSGHARYEAEAGIKRADIKFGAAWDFAENWTASANVGVGHLTGDAADSPIVESEVQPSVGIFIGYKF